MGFSSSSWWAVSTAFWQPIKRPALSLALGTVLAERYFFISSFFVASFILCFSHFDGYDVNLVLRSIHVGCEGYLMPFMALQGFGIGDRPALVVFVDKRLSI